MMLSCKLLIVDDDEGSLEQVKKIVENEHKQYAKKRGIELTIDTASSPEDLKEHNEKPYGIILSNVCLTKADESNPSNSTAIRWLEENAKAIKPGDIGPIIILLSAHIGYEAIIQGILDKLPGIRIIPKEPNSLWKLQLSSALEQFKTHKSLRYVDRRLRAFVLEEGRNARERKHMAILFADIRNYTSLCNCFRELLETTISPLMEKYFTQAEAIIYKHGGIFDKVLGDGLMAEFIYDTKSKRSYLECVLAATDELVDAFVELKNNLRKELPEWNDVRKNAVENLNLGCGIHWGNVHFGVFGNENRKYLTAMGHEVNMAQRLESAARFNDIPSDYRKEILPDSKRISINKENEVAAIILLSEDMANNLPNNLPYVGKQREVYYEIPTTSEKDHSTGQNGNRLYIKDYNNNGIHRNVYCRIITHRSLDEQRRKKPQEMDSNPQPSKGVSPLPGRRRFPSPFPLGTTTPHCMTCWIPYREASDSRSSLLRDRGQKPSLES